MASQFRTNVGESLATVEKHNTPLDEATTPSLDALQAYSEGWRVMRVHGEAAGAPFFKHAIEIDPKFAIAYAWLGVIHSSIGEPGLAAQYASKAYELRDRANDRERFMITAYYDGRVTGNMECLSGFPDSLERRRSRRSHPEAGKSRVRKAAIKRDG
jgi:hypothetical protein